MSTVLAALAGLVAGPLLWVGIAATSRRPTPSSWWWPAVLIAGSACAGGWAGYWTTSARPAVAWQAAVAAAAAFAVFYVMDMVSGMGYGDVKLAPVIAGCGGYSSPTLAAATLLAGLLIAGIAGLVLLAGGRGRGHQLALGPCLLLGAATSLAVLGHAG